MIDLNKYTRNLGVKGSNRTFGFAWEEITGPEANEESNENRRRVAFVNDLAYWIVQDIAALTGHEVLLKFAESELDAVTKNNRWLCALKSPGYDAALRDSGHFCGRGIIRPYTTRIPTQMMAIFCRAFWAVINIIPEKKEDEEAILETAERILYLICMRYEQAMKEHYSEMSTDYLDAPLFIAPANM